MTTFTRMTRDQRLAVVVMLPHPSNSVSCAEAAELLELVEQLAAHFRGNLIAGHELTCACGGHGARKVDAS